MKVNPFQQQKSMEMAGAQRAQQMSMLQFGQQNSQVQQQQQTGLGIGERSAAGAGGGASQQVGGMQGLQFAGGTGHGVGGAQGIQGNLNAPKPDVMSGVGRKLNLSA